MKKYLKKLIPESIQIKISSKKLAKTSKRLDICSAQFANILHLADRLSLKDKVCMEIGAGWVLSHAIVCHLLGAKKVYATDIEPLARPLSLKFAVSDSEKSIIRDILAPFFPHHNIRELLDNVCEISNFSFEELKKLGIEYIAPINLTKEKPGFLTDFIYSFSVMEHVPVSDIENLLHNLKDCLSPGGVMIHCIHLEDHRDFQNNPFSFLGYPGELSTLQQNERGNRVRKSHWMKYFNNLDGMNTKIIYEWKRHDRELPDKISKFIMYDSEDDLRTSHLGVFAVKK